MKRPVEKKTNIIPRIVDVNYIPELEAYCDYLERELAKRDEKPQPKKKAVRKEI